MSDSQAYEEVRTSSDGVTVTKRFEEDEFPVPAIAFEFVSERDEAVTVTLTDQVPESVAVEDLGFHPEYGSEHWTIDEKQITFERELEAEAEYTTVYGIRATGADNVEKFLTEPTIETVEPPLDGETADDMDTDDIIPESDSDVVKDAISGEGEVPGLEDEDESTDEDIGTLDLKDPNEAQGETRVTDDSSDDEPEESATEDSSDSTDDSAETAAATIDGESVVSAMAAEIRQNDVPLDDLKLVQRAIDKLADRDDTDGVHDARVEKLQSDVADLRAYTDALEEFLEESGTGDQLIQDFESQLESFDQTLDDVQSELSETNTTVSEVRTEMDDVNDDVESMGETVDDLEQSLATVEENVAEIEEKVTNGDVAGRLEDIESEIEDIRDWQEQIKSTFGG
ncbi:hypothetical protein [Salinibaculum rarum]|uniref:hypothetical protein n=1 Tax=Salinibaculum rarum TaxID=3058903 RepID=UPI00265FD089|nr:hypothetical protein [Salinibaculum sp. KK48]